MVLLCLTQVQEAMLTGESVPVSKNLLPAPPAAALGDRKCMVGRAVGRAGGLQGSSVRIGGASAGIVRQMAGAMDTMVGRPSGLLAATIMATPMDAAASSGGAMAARAPLWGATTSSAPVQCPHPPS